MNHYHLDKQAQDWVCKKDKTSKVDKFFMYFGAASGLAMLCVNVLIEWV